MGYGADYVWPQKGMKTGRKRDIRNSRGRWRPVAVWHCEAVCECGPERFLGTEEWGSCRKVGSPLRKDRFSFSAFFVWRQETTDDESIPPLLRHGRSQRD